MKWNEIKKKKKWVNFLIIITDFEIQKSDVGCCFFLFSFMLEIQSLRWRYFTMGNSTFIYIHHYLNIHSYETNLLSQKKNQFFIFGEAITNNITCKLSNNYSVSLFIFSMKSCKSIWIPWINIQYSILSLIEHRVEFPL